MHCPKNTLSVQTPTNIRKNIQIKILFAKNVMGFFFNKF